MVVMVIRSVFVMASTCVRDWRVAGDKTTGRVREALSQTRFDVAKSANVGVSCRAEINPLALFPGITIRVAVLV
ncbi:MAG: hypothetical protein C7B43_09495 [Sulfobacillus benefaciens]|uniref:Uncharacterized protein n=1 Tax=Sulfobacillus benefaciens TaxID=453960 RepID=A0A2T2X373_9FIRM|nr:MAG: hypothetical protein C7B43_09495 [Sulfobacillus benefaciens]